MAACGTGKTLGPAEVASVASIPEIASVTYLASLMAIDEQNFMGRAYLDELAPAETGRHLEVETGTADQAGLKRSYDTCPTPP